MRDLFRFPNPVNEVSARLVAAGVAILCGLTLGLDKPWLMFPLAYGFVARVLTGPSLSPLASWSPMWSRPGFPLLRGWWPGRRSASPRGWAQRSRPLRWCCTSGSAPVAASLEAVFALCLGCKIFGLLMRAGVIPEAVCSDCSDIASRQAACALGDPEPGEGSGTLVVW